MSDQQVLEDAVSVYEKVIAEKKQQVKEAAEKIELVRQVQTESPDR